MLKRLISMLALMMLVVTSVFSQVTTSSITGTVRDTAGQALAGATITATHNPSATQYTTISTKDGVFTIPNARIGGPYTVKIDFVGMSSKTFEGINLLLGEPYSVNAVLGENVQIMENVIVSGRARRAATDKTGAVTNIGVRQINTLPTITRSISDFTRLTPQANGNSFGGRDARYNNIQVDGANLNNNFGLSSDPLPGGGNPISLDAIEEISVNIAPFDVRQANFTGAGISAVTRSGDNVFKGSAYGYYRDQSFNGTKVGKTELPPQQKTSTKIFGARVGGPIIKNKLFFFISAEKEDRSFPGIAFRPSQAGLSGSNISSTHIDSLKKLSDYVRSAFGYETGAYDDFPNFSQENRKLLGRIDWNINTKHRLTFRYSDYKNTNDVQLNNTSIPGGGITGVVSAQANSRFGPSSMSFQNSNYGFEDVVQSTGLELNSRFSNKIANQILATYTKVQDTRIFNGGRFPTVDIFNNPTTTNQNYMTVGMDPFTNNNDVLNKIYSIIDNFMYFAGKHTVTAGISYEYQTVGNMFMPASNSYYIFRNLNDFITNQAPLAYRYTYSLVPGKAAVYSAELKIAQLGFYVQDEVNVNAKFKLTYGLRVDRPIYSEDPIRNPALETYTFRDKFGNPTTYSTASWPKETWYWAPRLGFRWDMEGDKSMIVRGGTGVFTGRIPFVWLTNIPTNSAMYQNTVTITGAATSNYLFDPNPDAYREDFTNTAGQAISSGAAMVVANPNWKFPQVWRTNVAIDKTLGNGFTATFEAIYNKDINGVWMRNANQTDPNATAVGADTRPRWTGTNRINSQFGSLIVLENTTKGGSFMFTSQLTKTFTKNWYGSIAYTYNISTDVTANPGSTATSVWNLNPTKTHQNDLESAYSQYAVPHRIVGSASYRFEWLKRFATTVSLFYEGSSGGLYSYIYSNDMNGDGNSRDLMYIPRNSSEIVFNGNTVINGVTYTPAQQWEILNNFIEKDPYLRKHRGQYSERNGGRLPFYHRLDAKILQDIFTNIGNRRHTLQLSADILNFPNMLSREWGIRKRNFSNNNTPAPLAFVNYNGSGVPTYRINSANNQPVTEPFADVTSTASTWGLQLGLRYIF